MFKTFKDLTKFKMFSTRLLKRRKLPNPQAEFWYLAHWFSFMTSDLCKHLIIVGAMLFEVCRSVLWGTTMNLTIFLRLFMRTVKVKVWFRKNNKKKWGRELGQQLHFSNEHGVPAETGLWPTLKICRTPSISVVYIYKYNVSHRFASIFLRVFLL